jgi:hypothetical protein
LIRLTGDVEDGRALGRAMAIPGNGNVLARVLQASVRDQQGMGAAAGHLDFDAAAGSDLLPVVVPCCGT